AAIEVSAAGLGDGMACAAPASPGGGPGFSSPIGLTSLGLALLASGASVLAFLIGPSESRLPSPTLPATASLTLPALPEVLNSSASLRFLGALASIAFF